MKSERTNDTPDDSPSKSPHAGRRKRLFPPWQICVLAAAFAGLAVGAKVWLSDVESAMANIAALNLGFFAVLSLALWFIFASGWPRWLRLGFPLAYFIVVGVGFAIFKIDYVSGTMFPTFSLRFAPSKDSLLEKPTGAQSARADLATTTPEDFPQFLGPNRDLVVAGPALDADWKANPPRLLWRKPIGAGLSGFAAVNGYAVTQEQRGEEELVTCYEIDTGNLVWHHSELGRYETKLGRAGPRATPTIHEGRVYALGATGKLVCLDGATGELVWRRDLLREFGVGSPAEDLDGIAWGRAGSPLVVDGLTIVPAGGPVAGPHVSLVAYDALSGEERWRGGENQVSYSSPSVAEWGDERQVLIVNEASVAGHDLVTGEQLWEFPWPGASNSNASTSQAVALPDKRVLVSKGYAGGSAVFQLKNSDAGQWSAEEVWVGSVLRTKFTNVAIRDRFAYALSEGILECVELSTGKRQWKRGRYGHGQILLVADTLLVLGETGELVAVRASPEKHEELSRIQALDGQTWNNLCLYGDKLLVRNSEEAACYELTLTNP